MKAFFSYAHSDHEAYDRARVHLKPIEKAFDLEIWADKRIRPGDYWTTKTQQAIEDAEVHFLLMTPDFFASDYIFDHELPAINRKYGSGDLVLPLLLKRCSWNVWVEALQAAPTSHKGRLLPVAEWRPKDNGYDAVREQFSQAIEEHFSVKPKGMEWTRP